MWYKCGLLVTWIKRKKDVLRKEERTLILAVLFILVEPSNIKY